jgi:hypothetical protein
MLQQLVEPNVFQGRNVFPLEMGSPRLYNYHWTMTPCRHIMSVMSHMTMSRMITVQYRDESGGLGIGGDSEVGKIQTKRIRRLSAAFEVWTWIRDFANAIFLESRYVSSTVSRSEFWNWEISNFSVTSATRIPGMTR